MKKRVGKSGAVSELLKTRAVAVNSLAAALMGLLLTAISELITTQSPQRAAALLTELPARAVATAAFLGLIIAALGLLLRSLFVGGLIVTLCVAGLSFAEYYKLLITSTPLYVSDLRLMGQLGGIMELNSSSLRLSEVSMAAIALLILTAFLILPVSRQIRPRAAAGIASGIVSAAIFAGLFCVPNIAVSWLYKPLGAGIDEVPGGQLEYNSHCGLLLGLWRSVIIHDEPEAPPPPEPDEEELLIEKARGWIAAMPETKTDKRPSVIFVLAESFFDVTELPGIEYESDPLSDFHRICEEGVSGRFYTHTLGYGTENIEIELMTGINSRYLGGNEMIDAWDRERLLKFKPLPRQFADAGYYTAYLHSFNDDIYKRRELFPGFGFQDMFFSEDFAAIDEDAAAAIDYWAYMFQHISGEFYSDEYLLDVTADLFEQKVTDAPVFLWAVTMENHTPYPADKYPAYSHPFSSELTPEAEGVLKAVTEGVANSSRALGALTERLSQSDEPVIVVFFGDHRPGLPLEGGGTLYSELGLCPPLQVDWELQEAALLYSTQYVIWSNDPELLPEAPGSVKNTSSTLLGLEALRLAGLPLDEFWSMCAVTDSVMDAWTWRCFVPEGGEPRSSPRFGLDASDYEIVRAMQLFMRSTFADGEGPGFADLAASQDSSQDKVADSETERNADTK